MTKFIVSLLLATFSCSSFATDVDTAKSQTLINAFRTCGFAGIISGTTVTYNFAVKCTRSDNMGVDSTDPVYALSTYNCDAGAGKLVYAKAQVLFEAASSAFGSVTTEGQTITQGQNLQCVLHLEAADYAKRFTCTVD